MCLTCVCNGSVRVCACVCVPGELGFELGLVLGLGLGLGLGVAAHPAAGMTLESGRITQGGAQSAASTKLPWKPPTWSGV